MFQRSEYIDVENEYGRIRYYKNDQHMIEQYRNQIFFEQEYIVNFLYGFIKKSKFILDIGAHVGSHTIMYKSINPESIIYAFEPQKMLYKLLCFNISDNNLTNVFSYNNAIGEGVYEAELNPYSVDGENSGQDISYGTDTVQNIAGVQIGSGGEKVQVVSLDALKITGCDFIKIDVEGYEPNVLIGAKNLITSHKPVISFEVNSKKSPNITQTSVEILNSYGYDCHNLWQDNWIAVPINKGE